MSSDPDKPEPEPVRPTKRRGPIYRVDPAAMAHREPPPARTSSGRGAAGGLGAVAIIVLAVLRGFSSMSSHTVSSYDFGHTQYIDPHLYEHLDLSPPPDLSNLLKTPDMPIPVDASESQVDRVGRIQSSLHTLQDLSLVSLEQAVAAMDFERLVAAGNCKAIVAGLPHLTPDSPPARLPSALAQAHLAAVRARVESWCGEPPSAPAKPSKPAHKAKP